MGKVIVITGGAGVLCSAFAAHLAAQGHKIALLDYHAPSLEAAVGRMAAAGGTVRGYVCSVLSRTELEAAKERIHAELGSCDILINGAGGNRPQGTTAREYYQAGDESAEDNTFFNLPEEGFDAVFDLNIKGVVLPSQVFIPDMLGRKGCSVLNISSMNAYRPLTKIPAYSAAKAGVSNFTAWLAVHFAKEGIRVNAMAPGFFVTAQNRALLFDADGAPTPRTGKILSATPMGRFGEPSELLGTLDWLLDAGKSGFVTGITVPVDGGFSAYSGV